MPAMPSSRAMRPACTGPAPPKASSMKSRRSCPRMVEMALIASSIFTSMMRTMPSAASATPMPSGFATLLSTACRAAADVEPHPAAEEIVLAQVPEHEIAVGDGRHLAAARVAGRARHGAGALGPDLEHAEAVDAGDGAAAGAHGVDVHHRHREVAAFDLAAARDRGLAVLDQRHVAGGAAHVEGDDVLEAGHAAGIGAGGDAAGRAGQHGGHGLARGGGERRHAAVRLHDVFLPRREAGLVEAALELRDVARQDRLQVGVDDGRATAGSTRGSAARCRTRARCCSPASPRRRSRARAPRARDAGTRTAGTPRATRSSAPRARARSRAAPPRRAARSTLPRKSTRSRTSPVRLCGTSSGRLVVHHVEDRRAVGPRLLADRIDAAEAFGHQQAGPARPCLRAARWCRPWCRDRRTRCRRARTPWPSSVSTPCRIAREGSSGVDGTLEIVTSPVSSLR